MKEKKYPIIEEENDASMASEPTAAVAYADSLATVEEDRPILGPSTWEEALADLDESEREFEEGKCVPWENVMEEIKERYKSYAY